MAAKENKNQIWDLFLVDEGNYSKKDEIAINLNLPEITNLKRQIIRNLGFNINSHLCGSCKNSLICPKVADLEKHLLRDNAYPFIITGFQVVEQSYLDYYVDSEVDDLEYNGFSKENRDKMACMLVLKCQKYQLDKMGNRK
ncbi:MAG: hypothetical protein RSA10_03235 [Bacilli bacterium]